MLALNFSVGLLGMFLRWLKVRLSYLVNSWIYTTNHKRISINYFGFALLAGAAGMSLATVIRAEFAYPGIGILAGDSLQYLTIATAHGVIMVFFMIMPAIFGAFGNFLLPTQLGVHDVAFPRLNSAAFWFLPGGLIMLCQLVCVDRRYARMNCFSIRELQAALKRQFFFDLVTQNEYHNLYNLSMVNLRYKSNNNFLIKPDQSLIHNYGLFNIPKGKGVVYKSDTVSSSLFGGYFYELQNFFINFFINILNGSFNMRGFLSKVSLRLDDMYRSFFIFFKKFNNNEFVGVLNVYSNNFFSGIFNFFYFYCNIVYILRDIILLQLNHLLYTFSLDFVYEFVGIIRSFSIFLNKQTHIYFTTENIISTDSFYKYNTFTTETNSPFRFVRFYNPLINYDYKSGNYLGNWDQIYNSLLISFIEVGRGIRKASWFYSDQFTDLLKKNLNLFNIKFTVKLNLRLSDVDNWYASHVTPNDIYFNIYYLLKKNEGFINLRWFALNSVDQKFYNMFNNASVQQRILGNWRSLKFSREAWRSKLLAARHQNTLYRRFTSEEGLVWSIERNAKDLLPGWAMITPFSARTRFTAIGRTDIGLLGVFLALNASIVSSANFLVTYRYLSTLNNRKMRDARSFFSEGLITASWMMIAANPMLAIGILMLLSDRHWQTSFFDYSGGGDTVLFQHMFWFFGHPEVYIIMLPVFGFTNTIMSYYFRKRVSARASLLYSMYTIAFLGFFVWGHHMYMVGLSHTTRMLFSTLTVMISVPAATKLMHWCVTIVNSFFVMELPLLFSLTFVFFFVCGGVSGMCVAHTGMDVLFHDTFYVIGHFHVMFAGSAMLGVFAAFYFYFPVLYGVKYSRIYAYIHYTYYILGQLLTVIPMFWLGYCGMPRRVLDYPSSLGGWHSIASAGHLLSVAALLSFFIMIYDSIRQSKPTIRNTFGASRVNTRLNFYLFEAYRLSFIQQKSYLMYRINKNLFFRKKQLNKLVLVEYETVLYSYSFLENTK